MTDDTKKPDEALDAPEPSEPSAVEPSAAEPSAVEPSESDAETAPAKPKKLKKAKKAETAEKVIDDSPEGRQLEEARVAFEIGDYKTTRALATKLAGHERATIADGARDLLRRTSVDPAQIIFLTACLCALIGVAFYYLR